MIIRLAQPTDAQQLAILNERFNGVNILVRKVADYLANCPETEKTVVAEVDEVLAGFGCLQIYRSWCYSEPWAEITELYVAPEHRKRGIARGIVHQLEQMATDAGVTEIVLLVNERNDAAQSLYRACEYAPKSRLSFHKNMKQPESA